MLIVQLSRHGIAPKIPLVIDVVRPRGSIQHQLARPTPVGTTQINDIKLGIPRIVRNHFKKERISACARFKVQTHIVDTGFVVGKRRLRFNAHIIDRAFHAKVPRVGLAGIRKLLERRRHAGARLRGVVTGRQDVARHNVQSEVP